MSKLAKPDSGYAWVVAFAACIINMIVSGMGRMSGLLYVAVIDVYGVTREEASLPFIVRSAIRSVSGPVVAVLGQYFGIREVTFCGGLIACLGSVLCCVAPTITYLTLLWGLIHGFGYSLSNVLFQVVVNQYFERHRASATGIVLSGACAGSFVFPLMIEGLLDAWGLFGCFLMLGGLFLHVSPLALLLRSPPWVTDPEGYTRKRNLLNIISKNDPDHSVSISSSDPRDNLTIEEKKQNLENGVKSRSNSVHELRIIISNISGELDKNSQWLNCKPSKEDEMNQVYPKDDVKLCASDSSQKTCLNEEREPSLNVKDEVDIDLDDNFSASKSADDPAADPAKGTPSKKSGFFEIWKSILRLYGSLIFWHISVSFTVFVWIFLTVMTVVIDYARDKNIPPELHNYVIYALTIGDLIGRLSFGWVTDRQVMSFSSFMALSFLLQGIFVSLFPFAASFWTYAAIITLYGVSSGVLFIYFPVLVHQYMDRDSQTIAMGCYGVVSGIVSFGISPTIGFIRDRVGSYDDLFYIIGLMSAVTGGAWLLEPFIVRRNTL